MTVDILDEDNETFIFSWGLEKTTFTTFGEALHFPLTKPTQGWSYYPFTRFMNIVREKNPIPAEQNHS